MRDDRAEEADLLDDEWDDHPDDRDQDGDDQQDDRHDRPRPLHPSPLEPSDQRIEADGREHREEHGEDDRAQAVEHRAGDHGAEYAEGEQVAEQERTALDEWRVVAGDRIGGRGGARRRAGRGPDESHGAHLSRRSALAHLLRRA